MDKLVESMKVVLATSFSFALKTQGYHWNVEGIYFSQFHKLFGKIYEEVFTAIDNIAEEIRALDAYAPASLGRFYQLSLISDEVNVPGVKDMCRKLIEDSDKIQESLMATYTEADSQKQLGLANFLQGRMEIHKKHAWMLKSSIKDI